MRAKRFAWTSVFLLLLFGLKGSAVETVPAFAEGGDSQKGRKMIWSIPFDAAHFGVEDLYKLLHQAYLGPGHAIPSREAAAAYLEREWAALEAAGPGEPLVEVLAEGAPFVRIHLRPFRDRGGTADSLLGAFLRSADVPIDSVSFKRAWSLARERIARGEIELSIAGYDSADAELRPLGFPAIHHSAAYQQHHRPAYRVVAAREVQRLQASLSSEESR